MTEPWLTGPLEGVDPLVTPLFHTFAQTRQELADFTAGMTVEELWMKPHGLTPVGFHIRHIGSSVDRLSTYLLGRQLSEMQINELKHEGNPGANRDKLLAEMNASLARCETAIHTLDLSAITETRTVGRRHLPTTVQGLLVHLSEHTFRHLGQAITMIKLVKALRHP